MKRIIIMVVALISMISIMVSANNDIMTTIDSDDEIQRTIVSINDIRNRIDGLSGYKNDDLLQSMALTHSKYMAYNKIFSSIEEEGQSYFRGKYPWDRADEAGYAKNFVYEFVKKDYANYMEAYRELLNEPTSRAIVLSPTYTDIGMNVHENYMTFELGGNPLDYNVGIMYPYEGQKNVQPIWKGNLLDRLNTDANTSLESSGLPITYTYYGKDIVSIRNKNFKMINKETKEEIPFELVEPGVYYQLKNTVTLVPLRLKYGRDYQVNFAFDMELEDGKIESVNKVINFRTIDMVESTAIEQKFITREAFVEKIISNEYLKIPLVEPLEIKFSDVDINSHNSIYIHTASEMGIINGYPDGRFGPALNITKNQAYAILIKAYESKLNGTNNNKYPSLDKGNSYIFSQYKDSDQVANWGKSYVNKAIELGIVIAEEGYLRPNDYLTVDEFNQIMTIFDSKID